MVEEDFIKNFKEILEKNTLYINEIDNLNKINFELKEQLKMVKQESIKLENAVFDLKIENRDLMFENSFFQQKLDFLKEKVIILENNDIKNLQNQKRLVDENMILINQLNDLKNKNSELEAENIQIKTLINENRALYSTIEFLLKEKEALIFEKITKF